MAMLEVWAPAAERVEASGPGGSTPLEAGERGWWRGEAPWLGHGGRYGFLLDGEGPFPDPRSGFQPDGPEGLSTWIDHQAYAWSDGNWRPPPFSAAVFYELHVGTFTPAGSFHAAIAKLDYLARLGVTHLELMPVACFEGERGWGYDSAFPYAPHRAYGGPENLKRLVDAAHARGLAVILDVVFNHLGPGNRMQRFGPYLTDRYRTPWGAALNFDGRGSHGVRDFLIGAAQLWLRDYHFDGLRLDAVHEMHDRSATHILEELAASVRALQGRLGRHLCLVAESDLNDPRLMRAPVLGGFGLDAQWNEDFHHALHAALTGERMAHLLDFNGVADLAKCLRSAYVYDGQYSPARERRFGRPAGGLSGHAFLGYIQNHDQPGNRGGGERSSRLLDEGQLKCAAALIFCAPFLPLIFAGEEWGASTPFFYFSDHADPELARAVREGRRRDFAPFLARNGELPDPQDEASFLRSKLDWDEPEAPFPSGMLDWHRRLIRLRRRCPALRDGRMEAVLLRHDERENWLMMARGPILLACNFAAEPRRLPAWRAQGGLLMASHPEISQQGEELLLPGHSVGIWGPQG